MVLDSIFGMEFPVFLSAGYSFDLYISSCYTFIPNCERIVFPWKCHYSFVAVENLFGARHVTLTKSSFFCRILFVPAKTKVFSKYDRAGNFICTGCWSANIFVDLLTQQCCSMCMSVSWRLVRDVTWPRLKIYHQCVTRGTVTNQFFKMFSCHLNWRLVLSFIRLS